MTNSDNYHSITDKWFKVDGEAESLDQEIIEEILVCYVLLDKENGLSHQEFDEEVKKLKWDPLGNSTHIQVSKFGNICNTLETRLKDPETKDPSIKIIRGLHSMYEVKNSKLKLIDPFGIPWRKDLLSYAQFLLEKYNPNEKEKKEIRKSKGLKIRKLVIEVEDFIRAKTGFNTIKEYIEKNLKKESEVKNF